MKKKLVSVLLAVGLCLSATSTVLACDDHDGVHEDCFRCDCSSSTEHGNHKYEKRYTVSVR